MRLRTATEVQVVKLYARLIGLEKVPSVTFGMQDHPSDITIVDIDALLPPFELAADGSSVRYAVATKLVSRATRGVSGTSRKRFE